MYKFSFGGSAFDVVPIVRHHWIAIVATLDLGCVGILPEKKKLVYSIFVDSIFRIRTFTEWPNDAIQFSVMHSSPEELMRFTSYSCCATERRDQGKIREKKKQLLFHVLYYFPQIFACGWGRTRLFATLFATGKLSMLCTGQSIAAVNRTQREKFCTLNSNNLFRLWNGVWNFRSDHHFGTGRSSDRFWCKMNFNLN